LTWRAVIIEIHNSVRLLYTSTSRHHRPTRRQLLLNYDYSWAFRADDGGKTAE